jgi:NAD(P)-dependent dehydrogenase (short-subunit alcohol dehydrogenase family)
MTPTMGGAVEGRVALVQGGSQGMGRATALALAAAGATVIVAARGRDACEAVVAQIESSGGRAAAMPVDVTDPESLATQFATIESRYGRLDLAFNNVGATLGSSPTHETPSERFIRTLDVNLVSMFRCMQHEIGLMLRGDGGAIVNTSSIGGRRGFANIQDYCAAKWGVIGLSKSAALEYARRGIRINVVAPGLVDTARFQAARVNYPQQIEQRLAEIPMARPGSADEVAATVLWLLSPAAQYMTGEVIALDGGECAR